MKFQKSKILTFLFIQIFVISLVDLYHEPINSAKSDSIKFFNMSSSEENDSWTIRWSILGFDWGNSLDIDSSDNIYVLGRTENTQTLEEYNFLTIFNKSGKLLLQNLFDNNNTLPFYYKSIKIDENNNIYVLGNLELQHEQYMILSKYDDTGKQIWNKTWGGYRWHRSRDMDIDSLGNICVVGSTKVNELGSIDMYLVKINISGAILWNHTWGGEKMDEYTAIRIDSNDNIYVAGQYNYISILMKFNSSGYCKWNYTWGDYQTDYGLTVDSDNNIIVADEYILQKLNSNGILLWNYSKLHSLSPKSITDFFNNIYIAESRSIKCYDNSFLRRECGCTAIYLMKLNSSGTFLWEKRCTGCGDARCTDVGIDSTGNIYILGVLIGEFGCSNLVWDTLLMKNPKAFEGECIETYYDLLIPTLIFLVFVLIGLIFLVRYKIRRRYFI